MKKIMLITSLSLLITCQAQAAKFISGSEPSVTPASTAKPASANSTSNIVIAAAPASAPAPRPASPSSTTDGIDTGFYIGAQLGDSSVGAVMGYQFTKMFGMEVSYDYFDPKITQAVTETIADKNIVGASGLAMFPMKFSEMGPMALYVKVGYARTINKLTTNDPGPPTASTYITTTTTTGVTGGAGIHVDMSKSASVRLGVNVVGSDRTTYLAALYRF